jgi:hypothetical protein
MKMHGQIDPNRALHALGFGVLDDDYFSQQGAGLGMADDR